MIKIEDSNYTKNLTNKDYSINKLLYLKADPTVTDRKDGMTPLDLARKSGQTGLTISKMLKDIKGFGASLTDKDKILIEKTIESINKKIEKLVSKQDKTDERVNKLEQFQQETKKLTAKIQSDPSLTDNDKILMAKTIESINKKMENLASKADVETITSSMKDLINEGKITKGKLQDLEDDVDNISARQDETEDRKSVV